LGVMDLNWKDGARTIRNIDIPLFTLCFKGSNIHEHMV
jgi:hypothetical protein